MSMRLSFNNYYPCHFAEKYRGIPVVHLALPRIEADQKFLDFFNTHARPVLRINKTNGYPFTREEAELKAKNEPWFENEYVESGCNWKGLFLTEPVDTTMQHVYMDINQHFPELRDQLFDLLPVRSITTIRCWENLKRIGLHRDLREQYPFPSSLRIMLHDENPTPTFWMYPWPEDKQGWGYERLMVDDPSAVVEVDAWRHESNSFLFNNYHWCHAAHKDPKYSKILMFVEPEWNWKKFEILLDHSIEKYWKPKQ